MSSHELPTQNVLHVVASMDPRMGGVCQAVRSMIAGAELFADLKNEVVSVDGPDEASAFSDPFVLHALGPAQTPWAYSKRLLPWLTRNLGRFDVILIHGLWLYQGWAITNLIRNMRERRPASNFPKVYIFPHGMLDPYFQKEPSRRFKSLRNKVYWKFFERKVVSGADGLLFTCDEEMLLARESFCLYRPKIEKVVGLGVEDPPPFAESMRSAFARKCNIPNDRSYFLFLSRIHQKKGVDILIQAYSDLIKYNNDLGEAPLPDLVIAGPLDSDYATEMRNLANNLILSDGSIGKHSSIHFTDMLTGEQKWGAFYGCEAFVLPSHQENFGIAVVESLACSKPVIISNKVNIWREILNNNGGLVSNDEENDFCQLLQCWVKMRIHEKLAMSSKARETYENHFSVRRTSEIFTDFLRSGS